MSGPYFAPSLTGAIKKQTKTIQHVPAKNPNFFVDEKELPCESLAQENNLRSDRRVGTRCAVKSLPTDNLHPKLQVQRD